MIKIKNKQVNKQTNKQKTKKTKKDNYMSAPRVMSALRSMYARTQQ